jgi:hypothetical protein
MKAPTVPRMPIAFQARLKPASAAMTPAAIGGLRRARRPIRNSATSNGVAITTQTMTNTSTNALPPLVPARYGNRQMLPSPTAAPTVAK